MLTGLAQRANLVEELSPKIPNDHGPMVPSRRGSFKQAMVPPRSSCLWTFGAFLVGEVCQMLAERFPEQSLEAPKSQLQLFAKLQKAGSG